MLRQPHVELYPIRIDVSYPSSDQPFLFRILDTIVIDPETIVDQDQTNLFFQWAYSIVSDAVVVGISRNANNTNKPTATASTGSEATLSYATATSTEFIGRHLIEFPTAESFTGDSATSAKILEQLVQQVVLQIQSQYDTIVHYRHLLETYISKKSSSSSNRNLIPIRLRLELPNKVRLHDDFQWDICNDSVTPIQMAQCIVSDLNLSDDSVCCIAIHILEEIIHFITASNSTSVPAALSVSRMDDNFQNDSGMAVGPLHDLLQRIPNALENRQSVTAAWEISDQIRSTNMIHFESAQDRHVKSTSTAPK
jgi:SNF5 / SMARCB1 / INI1